MEGNMFTVALIGSPEKEKYVLFRGLIQHLISSGKNPAFPVPRGTYHYRDEEYLLLNFPQNGQADLLSKLLFSGQIDIFLVFCSASDLESGLRHLSRLLKLPAVKEDAIPVVFCIDFGKWQEKEEIGVDLDLLEDVLQIPVLPCHGALPMCLDDIKTAVSAVWSRVYAYECLDFSPRKLAAEATLYTLKPTLSAQEKVTVFCLLFFLVLFLLWFLLTGAQVPSLGLWRLMFWIKKRILAMAVHLVFCAIFFCKIML